MYFGVETVKQGEQDTAGARTLLKQHSCRGLGQLLKSVCLMEDECRKNSNGFEKKVLIYRIIIDFSDIVLHFDCDYILGVISQKVKSVKCYFAVVEKTYFSV